MGNVCYNEDIDPAKGNLLTTRASRSRLHSENGSELSEEIFDVLDLDGNPTGRTKPRRAVHRDGDWHRAVNIWVVNQHGEVLLQRRSDDKDSWPGRWDISCGGHLVAGEDVMTAALNELREELGLEAQPSDLQLLSEWRSSTRPAPDFINNSFMTLYLLRTDREIADFTMQKSEISALKYISVSDLKQFVAEDNPEFVPHAHAYAELFAALA